GLFGAGLLRGGLALFTGFSLTGATTAATATAAATLGGFAFTTALTAALARFRRRAAATAAAKSAGAGLATADRHVPGNAVQTRVGWAVELAHGCPVDVHDADRHLLGLILQRIVNVRPRLRILANEPSAGVTAVRL